MTKGAVRRPVSEKLVVLVDSVTLAVTPRTQPLNIERFAVVGVMSVQAPFRSGLAALLAMLRFYDLAAPSGSFSSRRFRASRNISGLALWIALVRSLSRFRNVGSLSILRRRHS